jgi:Toprim-like
MDDHAHDLMSALQELGVDVHSLVGDEIKGRCPVHYRTKGRESTRLSWYMNSDTGLWQCFTCGARGNLPHLISTLTNDPGALWEVQSTLIANGLRRLTTEEAEYEPDVREDINWIAYGKHKNLPAAILEMRSLHPDIAKRFGIRWDTTDKAVLTPIVSPLGELKGWQAKTREWVKNYPTGVHKSTTLFGIERAFAPVGILVESPLDVARFHSAYDGSDYSCVASFGANVSDQQIRLLARFDRLVIALDNDQAGKTETKRLLRRLPSFRNGVRYWNYDGTTVKDLGEMTDQQIVNALATPKLLP